MSAALMRHAAKRSFSMACEAPGVLADRPGPGRNNRGRLINVGEAALLVEEEHSVLEYRAARFGVQAIHLLPNRNEEVAADRHGELIARIRFGAGTTWHELLVDFAAGMVLNLPAESVYISALWRGRDATSWPEQEVAAVVEPGPHPTQRVPTLTEPEVNIAGGGGAAQFIVPAYGYGLWLNGSLFGSANIVVEFFGGSTAATRNLGRVAGNQGALARGFVLVLPGGTRSVRVTNNPVGANDYVVMWALGV
jgi:hypothetical protein